MIISKAIEILQLECTSQKLQSDPDYLASSRLGIEALKRIQECRQHPFSKTVSPLPGETMPERGWQAAFQGKPQTNRKRA